MAPPVPSLPSIRTSTFAARTAVTVKSAFTSAPGATRSRPRGCTANSAHNVIGWLYDHQLRYFCCDLSFFASSRAERSVSFGDAVFHIRRGDVLDIIEHPNQKRYGGQHIMIPNIDNYAYLVPFVEETDSLLLETIIPSQKATRTYPSKGGLRR